MRNVKGAPACLLALTAAFSLVAEPSGAQMRMQGSDLGSEHPEHLLCDATAAECVAEVKVRLHPHDLLNRACLINVAPVIFLPRDQSKMRSIRWKLKRTFGSGDFRFVSGRQLEIGDNVNDKGDPVFRLKSATDTEVLFEIGTPPFAKLFPYTIRLEYKDGSGNVITCAPLDPVIVNRD